MSGARQIPPEEAIRVAAAHWTVRRDRGLSATEAIEYELWLAADPRHAAAIKRTAGAWARLDRIPEDVAKQAAAAATRRRSFWRRGLTLGSLAAAAAIAVVLHLAGPTAPNVAGPEPLAANTLQAAGPRLVTLADGTEVRLNAGGAIAEQFTTTQRRVVLVRGEAHFAVTKDPARPFVVTAGTLQVRAIGTAFNVNWRPAQVDVLVTEGRVTVATEVGNPNPARDGQGSDVRAEARGNIGRPEVVPPLVAELGAGELATVTIPAPADFSAAPACVVSRMDPGQIARALAWQEKLVRFGGSTLAEIASEFERRTGHRVVLADPALAGLRLGGRFRADDVEGFANLLATMLEVEVERSTDGALVLRKKK